MTLRTGSRPKQRAGSPEARRLIFLHGLSSFCLGVAFPYTAILLDGRHHVGGAGLALYYGLSGAANLLAAAILAGALVRPSIAALGTVGNLASIFGYTLIFFARSLPTAAIAGAAIGVGQGCFMAAIIPLVNRLIDPDDRRSVFAARYRVLNVTLGAGSLIAGLMVAATSTTILKWLFLVTAAGYIPLAVTMAILGRRATGPSPDKNTAPARPTMPSRRLVSLVAGPCLFQLGAYLFGFSQIEATMPLASNHLLHLSVSWASVFLAINTAVILLAQTRVTSSLSRWSEVTGVRIAALLWGLSYLFATSASAFPVGGRVAVMVIFSMIFAIGECAYSASYHPWLIAHVPEDELVRASALTNSTMGCGMLLGPTIGIALVASGSSPLVMTSLGLLCILPFLATRVDPGRRATPYTCPSELKVTAS